MNAETEGSFSPLVIMEVWSSTASEDDEEVRRSCSLGEDVEAQIRHLSGNSNNNNNNNTDSLCREVSLVMCSERVGQITKTYHDIKAVTHLLEEKERDLELAARIGQSLLKQNRDLTARNEMMDEQLEVAKEEIAQLRHELNMREDLLHFYASTEELENAAHSHNFVQYDFLHQKLKGLEEENRKLRSEANKLTSETTSYEEQEQELMMVCVEELTSVNKRVGDLSEELARKVEDTLRQQEEISSLLAQIVDLQARCKGLTGENEELNQHLNASRGNQVKLASELKDLQEKYSQCEDMLREAREDIKNLRNKTLPNSTVQRYSTRACVFPMDSLAAEIEGTFRKGLDSPALSEYKNHPWRVFETVKVVNKAARLRSRCQSPGLPGSSPVSSGLTSLTSTPRTSCYGSDNASLTLGDKPHSSPVHKEENSSVGGQKPLGQPGTPGGQDLEAALHSLSDRQRSHSSERPFFDVERERKLRALAARADGADASSGFLTPNDSLPSSLATSTGTNYSNGSSRHSCSSSGSSRSYLPDRLQIVKPLEGSATLHQWQQLAQPNLGGILQARPGVLTKDFMELEVDVQHVYSLNDLEEDEPDPWGLPAAHSTVVSPSWGPTHSETAPAHTVTSSQGLKPSHALSFPSRHTVHLPAGGASEHVRTCSSMSQQQQQSLPLHPHPGTQSLGLLKLLREQGISASTHPPPPPPLAYSAATGKGERSRVTSYTRRPIFSLNLVGKLRNLGLHRVAAWGAGRV